MCLLHEETMTYILSGCEVLDKAEYISRNNNAATYLHWSICKNHNIEITDKWYKHKPATMIHNRQNNITIMLGMPVNTYSTTTVNRPDIIIKDSVNSTRKLIDITVPSSRNIVLKETEKNQVQRPIELKMQRMWYMITAVIPVAVGAFDTTKKGAVENIKKVSERATLTEIQKIFMLGSAQILIKVLSI